MGKIIGVIPARYKSTRFEGKPLAKIGKKTMIQLVYERCLESTLIDQVVVATDDSRIFDNVLSFGGDVVMTGAHIATGTDRCYEAAQRYDCDIIVNIQGDEPLIESTVIDSCIQSLLEAQDAVCSTPVVETDDLEDVNSPHTVKAVLNQNYEALYFSRSPVPYFRNTLEKKKYHKHLGLYCYRRWFLERYVSMKQTPLELAESLEQLRILESGFKIQCCPVTSYSVGVDTPDDLEKVKSLLKV